MWGVPHEKVEQIVLAQPATVDSVVGKQSPLRLERLALFEHRLSATVFELQGARSQMRVCIHSILLLVPLFTHTRTVMNLPK